ncbi:MAG TPA: acyltransferase [Candidatus Binatia bacterium]|nr:acyltransferase [Candidatus Binatia bacterium]
MSAEAPSRAAPRGDIPSLDGIRAVAVTLVFLAHSGLERIIPGGLGVTIFFVLSGYLITTLMRAEHAATGEVRLRAFYLRRGLRLMPPLLVVVALAALLAAAGIADGQFSGRGLAAVLLYFGNYHVIAADFDGVPAGIGVVWSLAVEEHFYLFYPPLAIALLRGGSRLASGAVLGGLCAAVLAWRCVLSLQGGLEDWIGMATDTRIDAILVGCLMALTWNPWLDRVPAARPLREGAVALGCGALLLGTLAFRDVLFRDTLRYTLQSLAIAPLIWLAVARPQWLAFRWLNAAPVAYVGKVSYTIYLCHHLILLAIAHRLPQVGWLPAMLLGAVLTLGVAEPMRRFVEEPCARLRRRLHGRRKSSPASAAHPVTAA